MRAAATALALAVSMSVASGAEAFQLAPYKDDLFKYQNVLGELHGGDFVVVEFDDARDIGGRDEIRLKKAFDKFVSLEVNEDKQDLVIGSGKNAVRYMGVGRTEGDAKVVVIFLHGLHGDRSLAMEDHRFGGNFNRLKNLMYLNDGAYLSPDFDDFSKRGASQIKTLMKHYAANSPGAPIIVGCASTGCKVVFRLLEDPEAAKLFGGVVLLGSLPLGTQYDDTFFEVGAFHGRGKPIPVYIGHGSADQTVNWVTQELVFKRIKRRDPSYPIRYELFRSDDAVHGTPLRMVDWRLVINWMLESHETAGG